MDSLKENTVDLSDYYYDLIENLKLLTKSDIHALFLVGGHGFGKTTQVEKTLRDEKIDYVKISGTTTPLQMFHLIAKHSDKVILFDDCDKLFENRTAVSILKGITWSTTHTRSAQYHTTSALLKVPPLVKFTGKIVVCANKLPRGEHIDALIDRGIYIPIELTYADKLDIMRKLAKEDKDKNYIVDYIRDNSNEATFLSLRIFHKCLKAFEYAKLYRKSFEKMVKEFFLLDDYVQSYLEAIQKGDTLRQQVRLFNVLCGGSRATFYRIKKKQSQVSRKNM